jgi:nucleoside-diphosphate-sugar epimerase
MFAFFEKPARMQFLPYDEWAATVSERYARTTLDHIAHSPNCSGAKALDLLGYTPRYSSLRAVQEAVTWLRQAGIVGADQA